MTAVLIADDSLVVQLTLAHVLEAAGYRVDAVGGGREALAFLQRQTPDLFICDVSMPELDGLALLQLLRQDTRWQALPVILITGTEEQLTPAQAASAAAVLVKPVSSWQLVESASRALGAAQ